MTNYGVTDTSVTSLGANEFPVSAVFIPGDTKLTVQGGANKLTDGNGKTYGEALMHVADGSDVTQGTSTDANTVNSVMGRLTKIRDLLNTSIAVTQSATWNITNITGTVSLPTGASTSAKQPALGTAGSASTDVLTVQGIASMTALKVDGSGFTQPVSGTFWQATQPISGTVTANAGSGTFTVSDQHSNNTADYDTGAGTQTMTMFGMALPASGGSVAGGTSSNPLRTDPTGTTTQPVSGTVSITANSSVNVNQIAGSSVSTAATGVQKVGVVGNAGAAMDAAGQNATSPANELLVAGQFNTTPTTITSGNVSPLQLDASGNLNVNVKAGGGAGGTSSSFAAAFPSTGTAIGVKNGANMVNLTADGSGNLNVNLAAGGGSGGTALADNAAFTASTTSMTPIGGFFHSTIDSVTDGHTAAVAIDAKRNLFTVLRDAAGNARGVNVTAGNALTVDGSASTQPVSGTVSITANSAVNVAQVAGTTTDTNSGVKSAGTLRVVLATDQPALTNKLLVTPDSVALPANQSVNVNQIAGSAVSTAATGVQKVGIVGNGGATVDSTIAAGTAPTNALVTGGVYNTSAPTPTTGQAMALQADQSGNLRHFPGIALATLSAWNSGTSLNATQTIFTNSGAEAVLVQLTQTTTLTAGAITFEVSYDGSTWLTILANNVIDPTSATFAQISVPYTVQASTNKYFLLNSSGAQGLRIKLSTQITGTGAVTPNYALLPFSPADTVIALSPTAANFNVTATQGGSNWSQNVAQFGGTNVSTGTGAGGAGIPRVTVSNDSTMGANSATGSAVPANAFYKGGIAKTALPSAATDGNLTGAMFDKFGRQVSLAGTIRDLRGTQTTTISASTTETTIFTAVASTFLDVVMFIFSNTSATATRIDIRDTTAGSVLGSVYVPAGDMRGFAVPGETIPQTTVNTNWTAQCGTSVTDIRVYALVDKNK